MPPFTLSSVPSKPGCYIYKNKGKIIYIGKAKNLRKRVSQYFQKEHDTKTTLLVSLIDDVEFFITKNEVEALLLEANLIKKHKPRFNVDLKHGSRRYAYIVVTDEKYPRILTARHTKIKGQYFGPFTSGYHRQVLLKTLRKIFFIRTCRVLPKKPCLRYHLQLCKAPCAKYQSHEEYMDNIEQALEYLKGKSSRVIKKLEKEMKSFSEKQMFEEAKLCRDQIAALEFLQEKQIVESEKANYEDAINFVKDGEKVHVLVFSVRNGILQDKEEFTIEYVKGFLEEFVKRFYEDQKGNIPKRILLPVAVDESIAEYLSEKAGKKIEIAVPQRGAKRDLVELVRKNVEEIKQAPTLAAVQLRDELGLEKEPRTIECFDISHLSGTNTVGSMVQFVNGKPNKKGYRRFKIKTVDGVDDFRSIEEVVYRRYKRLLEEGKAFPDLVVIDGGAEQLAFAVKALDEAGVDIPIISLAKKFEEVYTPGKRVPHRFDKKSEMMKLLIAARDEAHRFGLKYHRLLRSKKAKQ